MNEENKFEVIVASYSRNKNLNDEIKTKQEEDKIASAIALRLLLKKSTNLQEIFVFLMVYLLLRAQMSGS